MALHETERFKGSHFASMMAYEKHESLVGHVFVTPIKLLLLLHAIEHRLLSSLAGLYLLDPVTQTPYSTVFFYTIALKEESRRAPSFLSFFNRQPPCPQANLDKGKTGVSYDIWVQRSMAGVGKLESLFCLSSEESQAPGGGRLRVCRGLRKQSSLVVSEQMSEER